MTSQYPQYPEKVNEDAWNAEPIHSLEPIREDRRETQYEPREPRRDYDREPRRDYEDRRDNRRGGYNYRGGRGGFRPRNNQPRPFRTHYDPLAIENCDMLRDKFVEFYKSSPNLTPEEAWKVVSPKIQDAFQVTLRTLMYKFISKYTTTPEFTETKPKTEAPKEETEILAPEAPKVKKTKKIIKEEEPDGDTLSDDQPSEEEIVETKPTKEKKKPKDSKPVKKDSKTKSRSKKD